MEFLYPVFLLSTVRDMKSSSVSSYCYTVYCMYCTLHVGTDTSRSVFKCCLIKFEHCIMQNNYTHALNTCNQGGGGGGGGGVVWKMLIISVVVLLF